MPKSNTTRRMIQEPSGVLHAGVDLALEKNLIRVIDERGHCLDQFSFPHDRGGYDYCLSRLEGLRTKHQATQVVIAMEPSNFFWKLLAQELEQQHIDYHLVNAYTVKKHREGDHLDTSKDDRRDAAQIAELSRTGHYTQTRLQSGAYAALRQYATLYGQLTRSLCREKSILWGLVGQVFPEFSQVFKDLQGETAQALLRAGVAAAWIRQLRLEEFIAQARSTFVGEKIAISKLGRVYQLAQVSIGLTEGLLAIHLSIQTHLDQWQLFQHQLQHLTGLMRACLLSLPEAPYLLSMRSLQPVSAALFLAEIGDPSRYQAASQWVKLAGIQPAPNTSGKKQRSKTPMSHQGRPQLRTWLYFTCLRLVQQDAYFIHLYTHLQRRSQNPLTKMQALGVLMNKLLHVLWALIHNQTFYHPALAQPTPASP